MKKKKCPACENGKLVPVEDIVSEIESSRFGICFDTGHAHIREGVLPCYEKLKERIVTFHLQDNEGTEDVHLPPGHGTIPWGAFFRRVKESGFSDPLVIDADPRDGESFATMLEKTKSLLDSGNSGDGFEHG